MIVDHWKKSSYKNAIGVYNLLCWAEWNIGVLEAGTQLYVAFHLNILFRVNTFWYLG